MNLATAATLVLLAAIGCASNQTIVENIPPPSFNGPPIAPQHASRLPVQRPTPPAPTRRPQVATGAIPRDWMPAAPARDWQWIIIHHSATPSGSARSFDDMHKDKGWDELGYHFVIGNGTESSDGQVEIGPRWPKQKWGAHAKTARNEFNNFGIGICLVGNFDIERPTPAQTKSLARLVAYLMKTYDIPQDRILGHRDTKPTDCPGRNMNVAALRRMASAMADGSADADGVAPPEAVSGSAELLEQIATEPAAADVAAYGSAAQAE